MISIPTGSDQLLLRVDDGIAIITFNNVEKKNALTLGMREALISAVDIVQSDPTVRVVILEGAGGEAFLSGGDLGELTDSPGERQRMLDDFTHRTEAAWDRCEKPIIARIEGYCIGAGLLMALTADIRVASANSVFSVPAARLGLSLGLSHVEPIVSLVGTGAAAELLFTGRRFDAAEARGLGLVNHVRPPAEIDAFTLDLAREIARNAPLTIAAVKVAIRQSHVPLCHRDGDRLRQRHDAVLASRDIQEGMSALTERRPAQFIGR